MKLIKLLSVMVLISSVACFTVGCEGGDDTADGSDYVSAWSGNSITADQAEGHYITTQSGSRIYFANSNELYSFIDRYTDGTVYQGSAGTGYYMVSTYQANEVAL